jgi:hypothetical protein
VSECASIFTMCRRRANPDSRDALADPQRHQVFTKL